MPDIFRERILRRLYSVYAATTETELMNSLQDHGHVSDEAVKLSDVDDRDLLAAYNATFTMEEAA